MAKARILAVDDQRYFRAFLGEFLEEQGYLVRTAGGGDEALHLLESELFEVVLTDMVMPGMSGLELVERVKARWPEQDVVVVTSVGDVRTAVDAMRQGASDYLLKPLDPTLLTRSLESILQRQRLRREHASLMAENIEYLGALSLYERAMGLLSTLALEPLADRIAEGLCLEVGAQSAVLWLARPDDGGRLRLVALRGLVQADGEAEEIELEALPELLAPLREPDTPPFAIPLPPAAPGAAPLDVLVVALRHEGRLLGIARLSDKLSGGPFSDRDRAAADRFSAPAAIAVANALRHRALEHRSFRDPVTQAYSFAFFEDVVRAEIRKAQRFRRTLSLLHVELDGVEALRGRLSDTEFAAWRERFTYQVSRVLRSTDLVAAREERGYALLLPETDALGAAVLKRRIREVVERGDLLNPGGGRQVDLYLATASYPVDGSQLEDLLETLRARIAGDRESLVRELDLETKPLPILLDALATLGRPLGAQTLEEVLRFLLAELERRCGERGIACLAPGPGRFHAVREGLSRLDPETTRTEVVLVAEEEPESLVGAPVTIVAPQRLGTQRPFALYYAEGPAYALIGTSGEGPMRLFHSSDRVLVEHLAFQLQRALGVPITR
jgi:DNA-binding response OmpR family regulator/GGDEF domain-containing protein